MDVFTIGHSNRSLEDFLSLLNEKGIEALYDVRSFPTSKFVPHFSRDALSSALEAIGITYIWDRRLGGYRKFGRDVEDLGIAKCFKSQGFRAYATYLTTNPLAKEAASKLASICSKRVTAIMCKERIPWRCHRKILADYLIAKGFKVIHLIDHGVEVVHRLSKCARVVEGELRYI
ncbi:MAG TPA: DUF488 family protein [Nitrososphaeria archaeon]|nr:DUF488 family protein [Nitrososphaeria archaeon]